MKLFAIVIMGLHLAATASAAERPADFAYGMALEASGSEAFYEVTLPALVYRSIVHPDLSDLRVFNGANEVVPHAFLPRRSSAIEQREARALTLFPLKASADAAVDTLTVRVRPGAAGTSVIDVSSGDPTATGEQRIVGYLIDASGLDRALEALDFELGPAINFTGRLRIEASDDLSVWRSVASGAPLVSLEVGGERLRQTRIEIPGVKTKYLRLSWLGTPAERRSLPELASVRGELASRTSEAPRTWEKIAESTTPRAGEHLFDLGGRFPVDRIRFELPQPNTITPVEVLSRNEPDQPWRLIARTVVYRLRQGDGEIASPEVHLTPNTDRYWLIKIDPRGGGLGSGQPVMHAGWIPHRLVFAARGAPPFQLAYGSRQAKPIAYPIQSLIPGYRDDLHTVRTAGTGPQASIGVATTPTPTQTELGGAARREEAVDWKRWSLWAALVFGVAVLGAMAWRLLRQMK